LACEGDAVEVLPAIENACGTAMVLMRKLSEAQRGMVGKLVAPLSARLLFPGHEAEMLELCAEHNRISDFMIFGGTVANDGTIDLMLYSSQCLYTLSDGSTALYGNSGGMVPSLRNRGLGALRSRASARYVVGRTNQSQALYASARGYGDAKVYPFDSESEEELANARRVGYEVVLANPNLRMSLARYDKVDMVFRGSISPKFIPPTVRGDRIDTMLYSRIRKETDAILFVIDTHKKNKAGKGLVAQAKL
jgi:hypothetical protein